MYHREDLRRALGKMIFPHFTRASNLHSIVLNAIYTFTCTVVIHLQHKSLLRVDPNNINVWIILVLKSSNLLIITKVYVVLLESSVNVSSCVSVVVIWRNMVSYLSVLSPDPGLKCCYCC